MKPGNRQTKFAQVPIPAKLRLWEMRVGLGDDLSVSVERFFLSTEDWPQEW
jgi:hypothetical protein